MITKLYKTKAGSKRGFSFIEIMFAMAIFLLIALAVTLFSRNVWVLGSFISTGLSDTNNGRIALKKVAAEIRTAATADTGAYIIAAATSASLTFYSDVDDDGLKERVRYFLSGNKLQRGIVKPSGSPLSYTATETTSTLLDYVTNTNIFEYYDKNYEGTTAPLSLPITIPSVRLVKITLTTDKDPGREPAPNTFQTQISIRNLKDNL